ncbi:hypothetical protein [Microcella frigidaquae]|uniref:Conjugal transfer/entry exclusion protein n=1 Tax=Microcella frigidaquae TaxID=424758 RepID=A0A840X4M5_9MICO|nr:hypothetical protein [Microcella frigidaquae]MBB5617191.1 conjugal transfer/entry exclusion protein [Microcella frigidaquae]NHN45108.1 hypothetical protein [Microcella frigidaquae]
MTWEHLEPLLLQTIATVGIVLAAVLPAVISTRRSAKRAESAAVQAKKEITNGHSEHVRDQLDRQHAEAMKATDELRSTFEKRADRLASDMSGIRRDVGRLADAQAEQGKAIHTLQLQQLRDHPPTT